MKIKRKLFIFHYLLTDIISSFVLRIKESVAMRTGEPRYCKFLIRVPFRLHYITEIKIADAVLHLWVNFHLNFNRFTVTPSWKMSLTSCIITIPLFLVF